MKRKLYIFIITALFSFTISSCEEMLEVSPRTSLSADAALTTKLGVEAALNGAYGGMRGGTGGDYYGNHMVVVPEVMADNMRLVQATTQSGRGSGFNINSVGYHIDIWSVVYEIVNRVNLILEATENITDATPTEIASIQAQAYFLRGVLYFDLIKSYGYNPNHIQGDFNLGVPVLTEAVDDLTKVSLPSRSTVTEVYEQIEDDLQRSIELFATQVEAPNAQQPYYATQGAAHAILSRLYLYWAKYGDVVTQADAAITSGVGTFQETPANYVAMWASPSNPESMYEIQFNSLAEAVVTPDNNSIQAYFQQELNGSQTIGWGDIVISDNYLSLFETGDVRQEVILPYTRSNGEQVQQTDKFQGSKGTFGLDNVPIIRISEVYLNRAEAQARLNNETEAQADLNKIRTRVGLPAITPTGDALLEAVLKERRLELAFEGQRWFDLTRLGRDIPKPTVDPISFEDFRILPPLPQSDIQINENLVQNPGY